MSGYWYFTKRDTKEVLIHFLTTCAHKYHIKEIFVIIGPQVIFNKKYQKNLFRGFFVHWGVILLFKSIIFYSAPGQNYDILLNFVTIVEKTISYGWTQIINNFPVYRDPRSHFMANLILSPNHTRNFL